LTVRIGLIGAGGISGAHLTALAKAPAAKVVAVADIKEETARDRAELAGGASVYTDFNKMLDGEKLDAVYLCTPTPVRREPLTAALERGLPVFCEKPAAQTVETAREVCDVIERTGGHVEVGYVLRHFKLVHRLRELLADDEIATVSSWYACPMTLDYLRGKPPSMWFYDKAISGGPIGDQATHTLDLVRHYAGDVVSVAACGTNKFCPKNKEYTIEDSYAVSMRLANGAVASHVHTWAHEKWDHRHVIHGRKRSYMLDFARGLTVLEGDQQTTYQPREDCFLTEDEHFVRMVEAKDFSASVSNYQDATKTLELTQTILAAVDSSCFENL